MKNIALLFSLASVLFLGCQKPLPDADWQESIRELQENKKMQLENTFRKIHKHIADEGNRPADTLLYDSLRMIDEHFGKLYSLLELEKVYTLNKIQDSLNDHLKLLDPIAKAVFTKNNSLPIDSFLFTDLKNSGIRILPEKIPDNYIALYKKSLALELMEIENMILSSKADRIIQISLYYGNPTLCIVKANKDRVREGEPYRGQILFVKGVPYSGKFVIAGEEYTPSTDGTVDYAFLPFTKFITNEKYIHKCVEVGTKLKYLGKDSTLIWKNNCYTHKERSLK